MVATGMSLTGSVAGCMTEEQKQTVHLCTMRNQVAAICHQVSSSEKNNDLHQCCGNRRSSSLFVEENDYSASFHSGANNWLAFWLYLVTSSYFLLSKKVNFFGNCSVKHEEKVSLFNRSIQNERSNNVNGGLCYSESLGSPHSTCSSIYYDVLPEISDFDRTSYWHSLLSLEEEDSELLSNSMISEKTSTPLSHNSDSFTEILDAGMPSYWVSLLKLEEECNEWNLDKASYWDSLLSLEEEDSAWLSVSMIPEDPSSPLSSNGDYFTDISDVGTPSYWDSLLKLEEEDNEWISDKESYRRSLLILEEEDSTWLSDSMISEGPSSPLSSIGDSFTVISDVGTPSYWDSLLRLEEEDIEWISDKASYSRSLLSLEEEDSTWLSDSMISEDPSSPLSYNGDSESEISEIGTPSYWDALLKLDEQDSKWIPDSKQGLEYVQVGSPISTYKINWGNEIPPAVSTIASFTGPHCGESEDVFSAEYLLETPDIEEFNGDEPLFWPFEGEFNWDSDESSFCNSPRKRLVFDSGSKTSRIKGREQKGDEDFDSDMDFPLEYFDLDQEFAIETLVGLNEFDGHEGLDSEFIGDGFMLEVNLFNNSQAHA